MNQKGSGTLSDLRTRRTLAAIDRSMTHLIAQYDFGAINVAMICREAGITRSTYYQYYLDKNDWLEREVGRLVLIATRHLPAALGQLDALVAALAPESQRVAQLLAIHDPAGDLGAALKQLFAHQFGDSDYLAGLYADIALRTLSWRLTHAGAATPTFAALVNVLAQQKVTDNIHHV